MNTILICCFAATVGAIGGILIAWDEVRAAHDVLDDAMQAYRDARREREAAQMFSDYAERLPSVRQLSGNHWN